MGGFRPATSNLLVEPSNNFIVVFAEEALSEEGEAIVAVIEGNLPIALRIVPSDKTNPRDVTVKVKID